MDEVFDTVTDGIHSASGQCGLPGFAASDFVHRPHACVGSVGKTDDEIDAVDASLPPDLLETFGGLREWKASLDSATYADVVFGNGWKVSVITCTPDARGRTVFGGDATVPSYEVMVRSVAAGYRDDDRDPARFVGVPELDGILREVQARGPANLVVLDDLRRLRVASP